MKCTYFKALGNLKQKKIKPRDNNLVLTYTNIANLSSFLKEELFHFIHVCVCLLECMCTVFVYKHFHVGQEASDSLEMELQQLGVF